MRTGLFGGTFNPVHSGHVMITTDILGSFSLDKIIVVPAATPPHKPVGHMADISLRLEMARMAFAGLPQCSISDVEARREGRSYTIDTVHHFFKTLPPETELFFIVGLDAFLELDTWKDYMSLVKIIPFIVINRPLTGKSAQAAMESFLAAKISDTYIFSAEGAVFLHKTLKPIFFHQQPDISITSTEIRNRIKTGKPVQTMIPKSVDAFIKNKGLYQ